MAQIPDSLPLDAPQGASEAGLSGVAPSDLGLGVAAENVARVDSAYRRSAALNIRAQAVQDSAAAQPVLSALDEANAQMAAPKLQAWNGKPGLAADVTAAAQANVENVLAAQGKNLTPGQQGEYRLQAAKRTAAIGTYAVDHEQQVLARNAADAQETQVNGAKAGFLQDFSGDQKALVDNYDGSAPGLTKSVLDTFDAHAAQAIAAAPAALQPRLSAEFSSMRVQAVAQTSAIEQKQQDAYKYQGAADQAQTAINTVSASPLAYDNVVANVLPQIAATLPGGLRKDALRDFTAEAAQARVKSLIEAGSPHQALAELQDGRYGAFMKPEQTEALMGEATAAARANAPVSADQAAAQDLLRREADGDTAAILATGKSGDPSLEGRLRASLSAEEAGKILADRGTAYKEFAAVGPVREMDAAQLTAAATTPPDPAAGDYQIQVLRQQAAAAELAARQKDPGAWALSDNGKGQPSIKGPGSVGAALAQNRGAALQQLYQSMTSRLGGGVDGNLMTTAAQYTGGMIGAQASAGIPRAAWSVVSQSEAQRLAATVTGASADQKPAAMAQLGTLFGAMPGAIRLPDGSYANPKVILAHQLLAAHISPLELSAIVDHGGNPGALAQVAGALADPAASKALPAHPDELKLRSAVQAATAPYAASVAPTPDGLLLSQGRYDRTLTVARHLMLTQGLGADAAAKAAAGDMASGYKYVDTWRIPTAQAGGGVFGIGDGASQVRAGAAKLLGALTGGDGTNAFAPIGQTAKQYAQRLQATGHWITTPDNGGLMLMIHNRDGSWDAAADQYARPVTATWGQLKAAASGAPAPFATPPANVLRDAGGAPAPVRSKAAAFSALSWAITRRESNFQPGLKSDQGALGPMQVLPETVATYAPRLGLPVDLDRARNDVGYNAKIGNAALADLVNRYGSTPEGMTLAAAAYFEGPGNVEGHADAKGFHPGLLQTVGDPRTGRISIGDFIDRLPPKGKAYVQAVLRAAAAHLIASR